MKLGSLLRTGYAACRWTMRFEASEMEYYLLKLDSLIFRNNKLCTISCFRRMFTGFVWMIVEM
jgi:hypothetical protein